METPDGVRVAVTTAGDGPRHLVLVHGFRNAGSACPTLVIAGDRDRHVPIRNHLATAMAIPRCGLQVFADVGHVPWVEEPDEFASVLLRFLDRVSPSA